MMASDGDEGNGDDEYSMGSSTGRKFGRMRSSGDNDERAGIFINLLDLYRGTLFIAIVQIILDKDLWRQVSCP